MGTHLRVLIESYPMNTNMTGFKWFSKSLHPCALGESSLTIGRVKGLKLSYEIVISLFLRPLLPPHLKRVMPGSLRKAPPPPRPVPSTWVPRDYSAPPQGDSLPSTALRAVGGAAGTSTSRGASYRPRRVPPSHYYRKVEVGYYMHL